MKKKRAVAYIRVSTAQSAQLHSFEFQEDYWQRELQNRADVELVEIYADRGISGSSIRKRPQFLNMIQDAREGKFDVIYTKSVSRFSRNAVELLEIVHELRDRQIEVIFENENIHTFDTGTDLLLSVAASLAENDLQVDSERQKWSIQKRIESGWISIGSGILGYRMLKDNTLEIVPKEAELIKEIFNMYVQGAGASKIARILNEKGYTTRLGNPWTCGNVVGIIENEKYCGDTIMGKSVTINGRCLPNKNGELGRRYYIENSHEPIVSKEVFNKAKEIREEIKKHKMKYATAKEYPFTGMIVCGICGNKYYHKINNSGLKWQTGIWTCHNQGKNGVSVCNSTRIKDTVLEEKFIECYNEFIETKPQGNKETEYATQLKKLTDEEHELATLSMSHMISNEAYKTEKKIIEDKRRNLKEEHSQNRKRNINPNNYDKISEFDKDIMKSFITKVIIYKHMVTFVFYNGIEISKAYTNGQPGNQKGWNRR